MLTILREFRTRSPDGQQMVLCECLVETDTTTQHNVGIRSTHGEHYFRQADGGMHHAGRANPTRSFSTRKWTRTRRSAAGLTARPLGLDTQSRHHPLFTTKLIP